MIVHRLETKPPFEPSVSFYRTIAISFLALTIILLGVVIFFTSKKATITVSAKEDSKGVDVPVAVGAGNAAIPGKVISQVFGWKEKYQPTGNRVIEGVAQGEAVIFNQTGADQTLVKTTRLLSPEGVLFRLSDRVVVPANGQITAQVYADKPGTDSEIGPTKFTIPGLNESKQKVIFAQSNEKMAGGERRIGILSEEDVNAAKLSYAEKVKTAFLSQISSDELAGKDKVVSVVNLSAEPDRKVGEEVSEFSLSGTSTVVVAFYDPVKLREVLEKEIMSKLDLGSEKVLSLGDVVQASLVSYDLKAGTAQLNIHEEVMVTLDANAPRLSASNFFDKSKDEIERYVLGLDHVSGVEVKFSPGWMRKAPSVSDRIKVVVKNAR